MKPAGFTSDGRLVLEERSIDGELQELVQYAAVNVWHCTCGEASCRHIRQIIGRETVTERIAKALRRLIGRQGGKSC